MIKIRQFYAAALLTLALTFPTYAGDMGCPGVTATCQTITAIETVASEMQDSSAIGDPVMEIALSFLLDVSSLL